MSELASIQLCEPQKAPDSPPHIDLQYVCVRRLAFHVLIHMMPPVAERISKSY